MTTDRSVPSDLGMQPEHLAWFSPSFPVGSFAFSSGLEWAIEAGDIAGAEGLAGWLSDLLEFGALGNDAILIAATHRSIVAGAAGDLAAINDLALALAGSAERRLETVSQGNAFRAMVTAAWDGDFAPLSAGDIAYPVAAGIAAAGRGLSVVPTAFAYLQSVTGALASTSVRLGAITQPQAQRLIADFYPLIGRIAAAAPASSLDDLGSSTFSADLAAIRHETLDGRLFRS